MTEKKLTQLYDIVYEVVDEKLKELNYKDEYELRDYFADEIIDYILNGTSNRMKLLYNSLDGREDLGLFDSLLK